MPKTHASTRLDSGDMSYIIEDWLERHGMKGQDYYRDCEGGVVLNDCHGLTEEATLFFKTARAKREYEKLAERLFEVEFTGHEAARVADLGVFLGIETILPAGLMEEVKHLRSLI